MKIPREQLVTALRPAADILRAKPTQDSPNYVKLEAAKNRLTLSAAATNQSAIMEVECDGELKPVCVPFKNLQDILPIFGDNVTMDASGPTLKIKTTGNKNFSLNVAPATDFASIATEKMTKIAVNAVDLADCIDKVKFAARTEDSRPMLFGVTVRLSAKKISAEAATGLIFAYLEKASISVEQEFLIPFPFVANIVTSLRNPGAVLSLSKTRISVEFDGGCYLCSFLECDPIKPMMKHFENRKPIGEITPREWAPIFRGIVSMATSEEKMCPRVLIDAGRLKHDGTQGSVDTKIDKLSKPLKLNASTFLTCLEAFTEGTCKASVTTDSALVMEQGELLVASTQLRD